MGAGRRHAIGEAGQWTRPEQGTKCRRAAADRPPGGRYLAACAMIDLTAVTIT